MSMADITLFHEMVGVNRSTLEKCENCLPTELTEISSSSIIFITVYFIIFIVATTGNIIALRSFWIKYKGNRSGTTLLLLHLAIADLIVCCTLIPTEIFWRMTIQWLGGDVLCKLTQFFRTFGLYLSSFVLIGVSFSRFFAIMFPMSVINVGTHHRINFMLTLAWMTAALFSVPQALFFSVQTHPEYSNFKQCVTNELLESSPHVNIYTVFSLAVIYFVPLIVIICTYPAIVMKLAKRSARRTQQNNDNVFVSIYRKTSMPRGGSPDGKTQMKYCSHSKSVLSKAKTKTFIMTVVILTAFVVCWTPYAFMTLWYMFDWNGAKEVDSTLQDALFLMAVANSCINPLIYGGFSYTSSEPTKKRSEKCTVCYDLETYKVSMDV